MNSKIKSNKRLLPILAMIFVLLVTACSPSAPETEAPTEASEIDPTAVEPTAEGTAPTESGTEPQTSGGTLNGLVDTPWILVMYGQVNNPTVVLEGTMVTALFAPDGALSGSGGCNTYNTTYTLTGEQLTINGPIASTMMACEKGMEQEQNYLAALEAAQTYQITQKGYLQINLDASAGFGEVLIYAADRVPLEGTLWVLNALGPVENPQAPVEGAYFTAQFNQDPNTPSGAIVGTTGCNDYLATYYATRDDLKVNPPNKTENTNCAAGLAEQEQVYFQGLNSARNYRILGNVLQIFYDGQMLNFTVGTAPSPPETISDLTPLNGTNWWYRSTETQVLIPGTEITAEFTINPDGTSGVMSGFSGCNRYSAEILGAFKLSPTGTTQQVCETPAGIMEQESSYLYALGSATGIYFTQEELQIFTEYGTLYYSSTPPAPPIEPTPGPTGEPTPIPTGQPTSEPTSEPTPEGPTAVILAPPQGAVNQPITFDGSTSLPAGEITSFTWDFGDNSPLSEPIVEYTFSIPGTFYVNLSVMDASGVENTTTHEITIQ